MPVHLPAGPIEAYQIAGWSQHVEPVAVHGRGAARSVAVAILVIAGNPGCPELLAVVGVQCQHQLATFTLPQDVEPVADDGRSGIAAAGIRERPDQGRPLSGPGLHQAGFPGDVVAVGTAPLRPIGSHSR